MNNIKYRFAFEKTCHAFSVSFNLELLPETFFEKFYQLSFEICEIEALTFLTEENKERLLIIKEEFASLLTIHFSSLINKNWRIIAGFFCCFVEWCDNVNYFGITPQEQGFIWPENPLMAATNFTF